jgi:glycosyltransferase involved in cell wall biosynthesis
MTDISVVIPTFERDHLLAACLDYLRAQPLDPRRFEVIVVDDGHRPSTERLVRSLNPDGFRYCASPRRRGGPAAARNYGWRQARGPVIAFTDDDCRPGRCWLPAILKGMQEGIAAGYGKILVPRPRFPTDYEQDTAGLEVAEFATANCFYRRDILEETGGFDERFRSAWREDADAFFTVLERKKAVRYLPGAAVVHPARSAPWGVSISQQRKSVFNALLYKKHPFLYRQKIQQGIPRLYYTATAAIVALFLSIIAGNWLSSLIFFSLWLGAGTRFALKRLRGTSHSVKHVAEMLVTSLIIPPLSVYWRLRGALRYRVAFV